MVRRGAKHQIGVVDVKFVRFCKRNSRLSLEFDIDSQGFYINFARTNVIFRIETRKARGKRARE